MILNFVRVTSRAGAGSHQARPVSCSQKLKSNKKLLLVFAAAPRRSPARLSRPQSVLSPGFFVARELNITNLVTVLSSPPHRENVFQKVSVGTPRPAQRVVAWCSVCKMARWKTGPSHRSLSTRRRRRKRRKVEWHLFSLFTWSNIYFSWVTFISPGHFITPSTSVQFVSDAEIWVLTARWVSPSWCAPGSKV